jgi:hypothetical protein
MEHFLMMCRYCRWLVVAIEKMAWSDAAGRLIGARALGAGQNIRRLQMVGSCTQCCIE